MVVDFFGVVVADVVAGGDATTVTFCCDVVRRYVEAMKLLVIPPSLLQSLLDVLKCGGGGGASTCGGALLAAVRHRAIRYPIEILNPLLEGIWSVASSSTEDMLLVDNEMNVFASLFQEIKNAEGVAVVAKWFGENALFVQALMQLPTLRNHSGLLCLFLQCSRCEKDLSAAIISALPAPSQMPSAACLIEASYTIRNHANAVAPSTSALWSQCVLSSTHVNAMTPSEAR
eukprot:PhF_6_TR7827/c0_g1_i9/m.11309